MHNALAMDQQMLTPADQGSSGIAPVGAVRFLTLADVSPADRQAWHDLGANAADENAFAQPAIVIAGLTHIRSDDVRLAFVYASDGLLIGVAPLVIATHLGRFAMRHVRLWGHPNSFCAAVLVHWNHAYSFWATLLPALAHAPEWHGARALVLPLVPLESEVLYNLDSVGRDCHWPQTHVEDHARALAIGGLESLETYWERTVRAKKRKEIRRQSARLAELGTVTVSELGQADDASPWIDEFLTLEQRGWKGAAGSALAAATGTDGYFRAVITAAQAAGQLCFVALRLDGRAIAMLATLLDGVAAFSFKTAYDEDLARFSPGVLIQRDNLPILSRCGICWADSCAAPDHPMIDSLWVERRTLATVVIALPGWRNRIAFNAYRAALRSWRTLKRLRPRAGDSR